MDSSFVKALESFRRQLNAGIFWWIETLSSYLLWRIWINDYSKISTKWHFICNLKVKSLISTCISAMCQVLGIQLIPWKKRYLDHYIYVIIFVLYFAVLYLWLILCFLSQVLIVTMKEPGSYKHPKWLFYDE